MRKLWGTARKFLLDVWLVFVSQILRVRHMWVWPVIMASFLPLTMAGFLLLFGGATPERILYVITGSITNAVSTQAGLSLGQHIGYLKVYRVFDYYASLPISKLSFILGLNLNALVWCVPSSLVLLTISVLAFQLQIVNPAVLIAAFVLGGFSLAGVGAVIGFYSRSGYIAGILTQVVNPIIVSFAPVYMPEEVLPSFIHRGSCPRHTWPGCCGPRLAIPPSRYGSPLRSLSGLSSSQCCLSNMGWTGAAIAHWLENPLHAEPDSYGNPDRLDYHSLGSQERA